MVVSKDKTPIKKTATKKNNSKKNNSKKNQITKELETCVYEVNLPNEKLYLVGTAHVSKESTLLVEKIISKHRPEVVYIELDEQRKKSLLETKFKEINLIEILKSKKMGFFIAYLILTVFQKKIAEKTGSSPGAEFKKALQLCEEQSSEAVLMDRDANTTIKRLWRSMTLWEQLKFIFSLILGDGKSDEEDGEVNEVEMIEKLKETDALTKIINQVGKQFPTIKRVMIDERDRYMGENIILANISRNHLLVADKKKSKSVVSVGVVGAGHLQGMLVYLEEFVKSSIKLGKTDDKEIRERKAVLTKLEIIPAISRFWKYFPWGVTAILLGLFATGFVLTDMAQLKDAVVYWVLANGLFSALGGVIALANPLTVLACFIAAPITSLNPMIGAGMVTAFVQAWMVPPKITDFETFSLDIMSFGKWWKNRITKVLLVFVLSSFGSAVGTWVGVSLVLKAFN